MLHSYSEAVAAKIDLEVNKLIEQAHKTATEAINNNLDKLDIMVRVLMDCETIYADEVAMIMKGASVAEIKAAIEARYQQGKEAEAQSNEAQSESASQSDANAQTTQENIDETSIDKKDESQQEK